MNISFPVAEEQSSIYVIYNEYWRTLWLAVLLFLGIVFIRKLK